jgi:DNA mismatch endonuclease (patch repair protein)
MPKKYEINIIKVPRFEEAAGFYTTRERSTIMSRIKGKNTKPELLFRKALSKVRLRYRINSPRLPGKPDLSNKSLKYAVFIDGEFWHGYKWEEKKLKIKSNRSFWIPKIERNIQRDRANNQRLEEMGFRVFRFWEHQVLKDIDNCVSKIVSYAKLRQGITKNE